MRPPAKKVDSPFRPGGHPAPGAGPGAAGYILVGGASSRFGTDKAFAELAGRPMHARMAGLLEGARIRDVSFVGDPAVHGHLGLECTADLWPGEGPLGGILTALRRTEGQGLAGINLIVSCDMPFLSEPWIEFLLRRALESEADVVLARSNHGLEPLCAVWRTAARRAVEAQFQSGVRKVTEAIGKLKSEVLDEKEWKRFDSSGRLFWNMNTPSDYREAQRMVGARAR